MLCYVIICYVINVFTYVLFTTHFIHNFHSKQSNLNYSLSEIKVEDGYVGKSVNSVTDNSRNNTGGAVGVVVRVKDSEKSKLRTNSRTVNENLQNKQNYEVRT